MDKVQTKLSRGESGFTLVELAIVMIIIGLLITGVLKGQEMINNAQITSTVAQTKGFEAALNTFRDQYNVMPGDMNGTPSGRIPNCVAGSVCAQAGNANGVIDGDPGAQQGTLQNENGAAWAQLAAADLISGVNQTAVPTATPVPGVSIPQASVAGSSWQIGFTAGTAALTAQVGTPNPARGHYLLLDNSLAAAASAATATLTPGQAARIDRKVDDGQPNSGNARAMGAAPTATSCASAATNAGVYNEALQGNLCGLYIRIQ